MRFLSFLTAILPSSLSALTIQIDYTYDTNNFFNTQEKRDAIEAAAQFFGDRIQDNLLRIDPAEFPGQSWTATFTHPTTGEALRRPDLVIPEDTIIIFVGARELFNRTAGQAGSGFSIENATLSWLQRVTARGQAGRTLPSNERTDLAPWGGAITFDTPREWNFSLEENLPGTEFVRVALHEIAHILGIGASDSWRNLIEDGSFTGPAAIQSYGSAPPADNGHFLVPSEDADLESPLYGSFGAAHGPSRPVLMLPENSDSGSNFDVVTDLDLAALVDIGWEITLPLNLSVDALSPTQATFSWPSSSFLDYNLERGTDLITFPDGSGEISGNALPLEWSDPAPLSEKAFYRLSSTSNLAQAPQFAQSSVENFSNEEELITVEVKEAILHSHD